MDRGAVIEAIQAFYQSRLANDVDACFSRFGPGGTIRIAGSPAASPIASGSGPGDLRRHLSALIGDWEWRTMEIQSLVIDGDQVAVHYRLGTRYIPTGDMISSEIMDLITLKDGKIVDCVEFVDTARTAALAAKLGR